MHVQMRIAPRRAGDRETDVLAQQAILSVTSLFLLLAVGGAAQETSPTPLPPALRYTVVTANDGNGDPEHGCCRVNNNEAVSKNKRETRTPSLF